MKNGLLFIFLLFVLLQTSAQGTNTASINDRKLWLAYLDKIARPVLYNLAQDKLKEVMPVALSPRIDNAASRTKVAYLEAFGRTVSGIAPWLEGEGGAKEEKDLREQYRQWTLKALDNATNPQAKDYLQWNGGQPLVDASFVALGLVRSPWLWQHLDTVVKERIITVFRQTRNTIPVYSNWILFSGMIEAFFCKYGLPYDPVRLEYGFREFASHWYTGDGLFSDGMDFHFDYYNGIVIHPYLATIMAAINPKTNAYNWFAAKLSLINKRYAEIQERMINTDGSYPVTGRSITYRGGVFHHLADISLRKALPASLKPAQVRGALTAVIKKTLEAPGTFTKEGWLNIGLCGNQPDLADVYITTGSLYLCTDIFLPLGLPAEDEFWSAPAQPWTAVKIWSGQNAPPDHAADIR